LLRGYEQFKLTHGSLTSILESLGQEALELQLERFFTVWAWSWDLSKSPELSDDLGACASCRYALADLPTGLLLHPLYPSILPLLDTFSSQLPAGSDVILLSPPHVVPSTRYRRSDHPPALSRHLLSLIPPQSSQPKADDRPDLSQELLAGEKGTVANAVAREIASRGNISGGFLGVPSSLAMSMDVRKWSWPEALTFGKKPPPEQGGIKPHLSAEETSSTTAEVKDPEHETTAPKAGLSITRSPSIMTEVDRVALEDAMSCNDAHSPLEKANGNLSSTDADAAREGSLEMNHSADTPRPSRVPSPLPTGDEPSSSSTDPGEHDKTDPGPQLDLSCTFVFLAESGDPLETHRRQIIHLRVSVILCSSVVFTLPC